MSFGSFAGFTAFCATSLMVMVWLVLVLEKMPSLKLTSAGSTLRLCAAIALALVITFSAALWNAEPDMVAERDPPVPSPKNTLSVSPWMYSMSFGMDAEPVGHHLLECGLVALALIDAAGEDLHRAAAVEADFGAFEARRRGALDGVGHAEPAQLAALLRFRLALVEAVHVGKLQRQVHALLELAAVVGEGERWS